MAAVIVCSVLLMAAVKVCIGRQFTCSVSKADYLALRNGFINAHIGMDTDFNFHKFLRRCLDEDFKVLVTISLPIWTYVVLFIFFGAHGNKLFLF
ncbi:hypothetical protein HPP92_021662 [Vanilla planifolia]|uniref:Uncharacterized protein n=1 Tax=Vanilla planifolia TaxID=51239 RepID=A0A835UHT7_VANPL|nr:hypothetical protein HPP92_021662 [Vanilla planifolia]